MANWCSNGVVIDCATEQDALLVQSSLASTAEQEFFDFSCKRVDTILVSHFRTKWQPPVQLLEDIAGRGHDVIAYAYEQGYSCLWQNKWTVVEASSDMPPLFWETMIEAGLLDEVPLRRFERIVEDARAILDPYAAARGVPNLHFVVVSGHGGVYMSYRRDTRLGPVCIGPEGPFSPERWHSPFKELQGPFGTGEAIAWGKNTIDRIAKCDWMIPLESVDEQLMTWCENNCSSAFHFEAVDSEVVAVTFDDEADSLLFKMRWL